MSSFARSSTLRSCFRRIIRSAAVPPSPNSRSKTARGLLSIGIGVVGDFHEKVCWYTQLYPFSQLPTMMSWSRVICSDCSGVSRPIRAAAI